VITRDLSAAAAHTYDVAIIGGGIYGACLALESARRGLRPLLVERADFGGATSWNSLRILHGGLRYLQTLDVRRSRESAAEQAWFCRTFPDLVKPLECLLPLYGRGLKRPLVFGAAVQINRLLAQTASMATQQSFLHADTLLGATDTIARFPFVNPSVMKFVVFPSSVHYILIQYLDKHSLH
jgi:glycerol-3-phosphate dehydrogenase